ncbi:glycosyltransferase family 4 protein [Flavobacterium branchiicola]|uniref:Glycosyltransferase family 4 protein n=1 Tax=Flavobacterium branchiicola TaxID=1114875 RepID=A0ABV9PFX2_9FLAO|nr:glycosyltransferase family 1 protein [Flavobacterium branchiicola]MBS7255459.1 glycosyltransferase family 4 protein [Flavobacterium branchiicola]
MKLILDNIVFSLQKAGGISTYWYELYSRILRDNIDVLFIDRENDNIVRNRIAIEKQKIISTGSQKILIDRFKKISLNEINQKFIFHSSYNRITTNKNAKQVITVHDFVHERFYRGIRKILHSYQKSNAIKSADAIIVISENTKKDLFLFFPNLDQNKVHLIYNGVSNDFFNVGNWEKSNDFLFIGSRETYKNFDFAVRAIAQTDKFNLNIVGSALKKEEIIFLNELIPGRWQLFNNIDNEELNELYNKAYALMYPSSYEGFGIPLLEAMKAGCPFIALRSSSIPEVAGDAGVIIDKLEIPLFNKAISIINKNREEIINKGFSQANKFSWEKCYTETLNIYKELYKS